MNAITQETVCGRVAAMGDTPCYMLLEVEKDEYIKIHIPLNVILKSDDIDVRYLRQYVEVTCLIENGYDLGRGRSVKYWEALTIERLDKSDEQN